MKYLLNATISILLIFQLSAPRAIGQTCATTHPLTSAQADPQTKILKQLVCTIDQSDLVIGQAVASCMIQVLKGAFDFLVKSLTDLWSLLETAYDLALKFGSFTVDYLKAAWEGTLPVFWAEQYLQGESFFSGIAKSLKEIPATITKFLQKESEEFRCLPLDGKVDYVCHAVGLYGPELILSAIGIYKAAGTLAERLGPKLIGLVDVEKGAALERLAKIKKVTVLKAKDAKTLSKTLEFHPRDIEAYEYKRVGKIVESAADFKDIPDGEYIFMVDDQNHVAYSARYTNLNGDTPKLLASHSGLLAQLQSKYGAVAAAAPGEFVVLGGKVYEVTNGSGRWRGTVDHLNHGAKILKAKGLAITSETNLKDYDVIVKKAQAEILAKNLDPKSRDAKKLIDPDHKEVKEIIGVIQNRFAKDPALVQQFKDYKEAYKNISLNPVYEGKAGRVNVDKIWQDLDAYGDLNPKDANASFIALQYVEKVGKESATHFYPFLDVVNGNATPEQVKRSLEILQTFGKPTVPQ